MGNDHAVRAPEIGAPALTINEEPKPQPQKQEPTEKTGSEGTHDDKAGKE